jgi:hypothetical protein
MTTAAATRENERVVVDTIDTGNYVLLNPSDLEQEDIRKNTTIKG